MPPSALIVRGARTHNLKGIDVVVPSSSLTVVTGPSGAGKSSLALDTIYAEAQRRFVELLGEAARARFERLPKPDVDAIEGLSPAIAIDARPLSGSPRSTLGTATEIADHLRLLYARAGAARCPRCGEVVRAETPARIVDAALAHPEKTKLAVVAAVLRGASGDLGDMLAALRKQGFVRAKIDGVATDLGEVERLDRKRAAARAHDLDVVVDRVVLKADRDANRRRLADSVELSLRAFGGRVGFEIERPDGGRLVEWHSERASCPRDGFVFPLITPALFSFNTPEGACPACGGLGTIASEPARGRAREEDEEAPELAALARSVDERACEACGGARLCPEALAIEIGGASIAALAAMPLPAARRHLSAFADACGELAPIVRPVVDGAAARLSVLEAIGVGYLSIDRPIASMSGGERQRVRLAAQLSGGMRGLLYVLDEPSIGLHPRDVERVVAHLRALRDAGNTVLAVEHDLDVVRAADHVIDVGPKAGRAGGELLAQGTLAELVAAPRSVTGPWLDGRARLSRPIRKAPDARGARSIAVRGVTRHNLCALDVDLPLGLLVGIAGPSGSGKSTLVEEVLVPALAKALADSTNRAEIAGGSVSGADAIDALLAIDAAPIGRTPRSSAASYVGLLAPLRELFAQTPEARARGYKASRFSTNVKGGRCEACHGEGVVRVEMAFLPDVLVTCADCGGTRFDRETLEIRWRGRSIAEVLAMSAEEARTHFDPVPRLRERLDALLRLGLGYLVIGQPAPTLSGGEAQRIKLARELSRRTGERTLYVLDEPTTGLHPADVAVLLDALVELRDQGRSVIVIEHDVELLACMDWVVELGPGAGDDGGRVVAAGVPEEVARAQTATAPFLAAALRR